MSPLLSTFSKHRGFSLLEALVGLFLFTIIFMGSSMTIKHMLASQKNLNISFIITNTMQARLQSALEYPGTGNLCDVIDQNSFSLNGTTYYTECAVETITLSPTSTVDWPILAVSSIQADAQSCAAGAITDSCYIVGR